MCLYSVALYRVIVDITCLDGVKPTDCEDGDIRLSESSESNRGRVEICRGNVWGTVCHTNYISTCYDTNVMCKALGYLNEGKYIYVLSACLCVCKCMEFSGSKLNVDFDLLFKILYVYCYIYPKRHHACRRCYMLSTKLRHIIAIYMKLLLMVTCL